MDGQGFSREVAFSQSVINIGSDSGNDIVLRGSSVADFHVLMHYDSGRWSVSPLNGAFRTTVNGRSLSAEGAVLQNGSIVEVGTYRLTMMLNGVNTDIIIQSQGEGAAFTEEGSTGLEQNIQLAITKMEQTEIEAGAAAEIELTVTNAGPLVANMQLQLQGIPSAWVQVIPPVLNLNEGRKGTFLVRISPPRSSSAEAGLYTLHFVAISPNYPRNTGIADTALTILPYSEFLISGPTPMQLKLSHGKPTDIADFVIINNSNAVGTYFVQSRDDSNELNFAYQKTGSGALAAGQEMVTVRPGDSVQIPMEITAKKIPLLGVSAKHHHYYTNVTPSDRPGDVQTIAGEVVTKPAINTMVLLLLLVLLLIAVGFIFQPYVHMFECQDGRRSQVIVAGGSAQLNWDVSGFASTVTLNNGQTDTEVTTKGNQYVSPTVSTTYTITAENLISSLLHITHKKIVQVLVVPSRPAIDVFSVDKGRALYDETVTLNWSVEPNATSAAITTNKSTSQLAPENYTGKLAQGYQTDTLISLKAQNDSGYDLKSLFINVASDNITLTRFTVWVRPNGIAVPEDNDVRRNTRWGALQLTGGTNQPARSGVNPQPAAQSNTLEIPDNYNTTGYGTQNLNPEVMAASGQTMPSTGTSGYQPGAGSGGPSAELLVSPSLNATPVPTAAVPTALAADSVIVRATAVPAASPEGGSPNRDFSIKLAEVIEDPLADSGYRVISYYPNYVLQKQEQILVEWSVDGVSKVKIENLSGDDLQNTGSEYAYPEKSTTYTLTAQVGETKKAYSLPVNVAGDADAGEGSGLNCELKANATTLKVPGSVMLTWSGGGNNRVQLVSSTQAEKENDEAEKKKEEEAKAKGEKYEKPKDQPLSGGTIGDYLQPSGFMRVNVDKQTTFVLNAYDASNNVICTKSVEVKYEGGNDKKDIKLRITKIADENGVSQPVYAKGQMVSYTVALTDFVKGTDPTGAIAITDGISTCSVNWPVNTCSFQAKKTGNLTITAVYAGDDNYKKVSATAYETVVDKLPTSIQINSAIKPTATTADVEVELMWDHKSSWGLVPTGTVTLTAGSTSCDVDMETETMTCAGDVEVVKVAKDEDAETKEQSAGSIYISVKNMGLKDATPDRITATYKGDAYFMPSTSQSVLFFTANTQILIVDGSTKPELYRYLHPYKPDESHANLDMLFNWVIGSENNKPIWGNTEVKGHKPTGTFTFILTDSKAADYGKCVYDLTNKEKPFSCQGEVSPEPSDPTVTVNDADLMKGNANSYTIEEMLLANPAADRVRVEYSGDSIFNPSKSATVLFYKIPTELNFKDDKATKYPDNSISFVLILKPKELAPKSEDPTGKIVFRSGTGSSGSSHGSSDTTSSQSADSCEFNLETKTFSYCSGTGDYKLDGDKYVITIENMIMQGKPGDDITAVYEGDSIFKSSTSPTEKLEDKGIKTQITLSNAVKKSDNKISLIASINPERISEEGKPIGTIVFTSGAATCTLVISDPENLKFDKCSGTAVLDTDGNYKITDMLMTGAPGDTIYVAYSGDTIYEPSTSPTVTYNNITTETTITKASKTADGRANFTVTLSWVDGAAEGKKPTGTMTLTAGAGTCELNIETGELSDCEGKVAKNGYEFVIENMTLSDPTAASIQAKYNGDSQFRGSESQKMGFEKFDTEITIDSLAKTGDLLANLIASLTWDTGMTTEKPTGTVTFIAANSTEEKGTCVYDIKVKTFSCTGTKGEDIDPDGSYVFTIKDLPLLDASVDRMIVKYSGDGVFNPSTSTMKLFEKIPTVLWLTDVSKPGSLSANATANLDWDVAASGSKRPTGTITFNIGTSGETCVYTMGSGDFTCLVEGQTEIIPDESTDGVFIGEFIKMLLKTAGADRISAKYSGDTLFKESSTNYYSFDRIDPKLGIVKVTDENGVEHTSYYTPGQKVRVYTGMPGVVKGTDPTGSVTIWAESATCTFTVPQQDYCELELPKTTGELTVKASYPGDSFYLNGSDEEAITVKEPQPLKVTITKITDEEGIEQRNTNTGTYEYALGEPVIVTVELSDYDENEKPTGNIEIGFDVDASKCDSTGCKCTISYPEKTSCKLTAPKQSSVPSTYDMTAVYSGNTYYSKVAADPVPVVVDKLKVDLDIIRIFVPDPSAITDPSDLNGKYYYSKCEDPSVDPCMEKTLEYFTLDSNPKKQEYKKDQIMRVFVELSETDAKGNVNISIGNATCNITYPDKQYCDIAVNNIQKTGELTLTAYYQDQTDDHKYVDRYDTTTAIVERVIQPKLTVYPAYWAFDNNKVGTVEFSLSNDSDLPYEYDISMIEDYSRDPMSPECQTVKLVFSTKPDFICEFYMSTEWFTPETIDASLTGNGCYREGWELILDEETPYSYILKDIQFPQEPDPLTGNETISGTYNGNTYFYRDEDFSAVYKEGGGFTHIDLNDVLKINNSSVETNAHAYFTAVMTYDETVSREYGKPTGSLKYKTALEDDTPVDTEKTCRFDLNRNYFECGTVSQTGNKVEFIFYDVYVSNTAEYVIVDYICDTTYYEESNDSEKFTTESFPQVKLNSAIKTTFQKADLSIEFDDPDDLTSKYKVLTHVTLGSKCVGDDCQNREEKTCGIDYDNFDFVFGEGCSGEITKEGSTYTIKNFTGIIEKEHTVCSVTVNNSDAKYSKAEFPTDSTEYEHNKIDTTVTLTDPIKFMNIHGFLTFDINYDEEAADIFEEYPSGYVRVVSTNDDQSALQRCVFSLGSTQPEQGCEGSTLRVYLDESGDSHWVISDIPLSNLYTKVSVSYNGNDYYNPSSASAVYTVVNPVVSIDRALHNDDGVFASFSVSGQNKLPFKYLLSQNLRFVSNAGGQTCEYSLRDGTFSGCSAEIQRNGDSFVLRQMTDIWKNGDTELAIYFTADYLAENESPNDSAEYRKLQTDIRVYDALYTPTYYAFLTVEMTYDQLGSDIFGVKPTGMLKINSDQEPTGKTCSFDLSSGAFPCGSLTQSGNKVTFIINRYWARGAAKIMYAEYGGDKFYAGDKDESSLQTENAVIEIRNAKRTNKNDHAYAAIRVSGIGSLTEKYNVYSRVRFGTIENTSSGYSISYCSFDRKTLELITSSCSVGEIRKEGDVYIIKDLAGSVLKNPDRFTAALSDNKFNSYVSATSGISYFGTTLRVSDVINLTNVQDHGRYLTLDLDYNTDFVQYYGDITPTGDINITSNSYAYSPTIGSGSCVSATSTVCNRWTISEGNVHGIIQRVGGSDGEIQVQYGGDDIFRPSSKVTEFVRNITPAVTFKTQPRIYQVSGPSVRNMDLQFEVSDYELLVKYQIIYDLFIQASSGNRALNDGNMIRASIRIPDLSIPSTSGGGTVTRDGNTLTVTGWGKDASSDTFDNSKDRYGWAGLRSDLWPFLQTPYAVLATQRDSGSTVSFTLSLGE